MAGSYSGDFFEGNTWPQKCRSSRNLVTVRTAISFNDTASHAHKGEVQATQRKTMNYELGRGQPAPYKDAATTDADNVVPLFYDAAAGAALDRKVYITFNNTWGKLVHYYFSTNDQPSSLTASTQIGWAYAGESHQPAAGSIWRGSNGEILNAGTVAAGTAQSRVPGGTQLVFRVYSLDDGTQGTTATYLQDAVFWASFVFDRDNQT